MTAVLPPRLAPSPALLAGLYRQLPVPPPAPPTRPRRVWTACDGNQHTWVVTPVRVVCQHCPVYARPSTHRSGQ